MSDLDRSLTNIDWLISCSKEKQPIKSKSEETHFCGNCLHCSRLRSRSTTPKTPATQSSSNPGPVTSTPNKPAHSYANIIATAIRKSTNHKMTLNEIYAAILDTYPYFRNAAAGWKNSVRHNLSLNKIFKRFPRPRGEPGKGAYWQIDETALAEMKRERKSPHRKTKVLTPLKSSPYPPGPLPPYQSFTPPMDTPGALNQSFAAFYRSLLEVQRLDHDRPVPSLRQTMDSLARGQDDLSDLDMTKFGDLVTSLNPCGESGELILNLKDSFSNFLRELSVSGARTGTETDLFPKQFPSQDLYSSDGSSSQEFDWNAIL